MNGHGQSDISQVFTNMGRTGFFVYQTGTCCKEALSLLDRILNSKNIIHKTLDESVLRSKILSQNIANVDTPGYQRKEVTFLEELERMMKKDNFDRKDVANIKVKVVEDNQPLSYRLDGNNVDIESEMSQMAQNQIRYEALIQLAGFNSIKSVLERQIR